MTFRNFLLGLAYATNGSYAHPYNFVEKLLSLGMRSGNESLGAELFNIRNRLSEQQREGKEINKNSVLAELLCSDLDKLIWTSQKHFDSRLLNEDFLQDVYMSLVDSCRRSGMQIAQAEFSIVESFPSPYSDMDFWAMSLDIGDHRAFGTPVGIFLKRKHLMPFYSPFLIAHELVHAILGQVDTPYLARGIEDGICDLFGSIYLCSNVLPLELCVNMLVNSRFNYPREQFWRIYEDNLRQACFAFDSMGFEAFLSLLKDVNARGRQVLKKFEEAQIAGSISLISSESGNDPVGSIARRLLNYPSNLVVSPLAFYLAQRLEIGTKIYDLFEDIGLEPGIGESAILELQKRVFLVVLDGKKIVADETKFLLSQNLLRYEMKSW